MGWIWNSGCSWIDGALVDDGDDGTAGELGAEVSFGEVAMEMQSLWNDFVNFSRAFVVQFRASQYIMIQNRTSVSKVMTI